MLENVDFDMVVGHEAREFLFGVSIAEHFHKPFVPDVKKESSPAKPSVSNMTWNTGKLAWRFTRTP